jgi:hypothetical protein
VSNSNTARLGAELLNKNRKLDTSLVSSDITVLPN